MSDDFKDVRYNKAWEMLIFTCDTLLLQKLTQYPLKLEYVLWLRPQLPAENRGPPMFYRSTVELTMLHAGLMYHTTLTCIVQEIGLILYDLDE